MSEFSLKSLPRNEGVVFLEFMNTKDFRFIKSAILECPFNYSILNKKVFFEKSSTTSINAILACLSWLPDRIEK